jgi:carbonic anhydrase
MHVSHTGKEVLLDYDAGSLIEYNGSKYELRKISFTVPASHTIDGYAYPCEMQLFHKQPMTGHIVILSVFIEASDAMSASNMFFDSMIDALPTSTSEQRFKKTASTWKIWQGLPESKAFYTYQGSLLKAPCAEDVTWIVFESPVNCSSQFLDALKAIMPAAGNARATQPLNSRIVSYNKNMTDAGRYNYGDRMRCYNEDEFRSTCAALMGVTPSTDMRVTRDGNVIAVTIMVCAGVIILLLSLWLWQRGTFAFVWNKLQNAAATSSHAIAHAASSSVNALKTPFQKTKNMVTASVEAVTNPPAQDAAAVSEPAF